MSHIGTGAAPGHSARSQSAPPIARGTELELGERLLRTVRVGAGGLLVLEGPAGIGKTCLIEALLARAHGFACLRAAGSPLEQHNGFGLVCDLLEPHLATIGSAVAGDPGAASRRAVALTTELAASRPVLLAIDDLQWADEQSLRWLVHMCARLGELPILIVLAWRSGLARTAALNELFHSFGERLALSTLSVTAIDELRAVAAAGGHAQVAAEVGRRVVALGPDVTGFLEAIAVLGERAQLRTAAALAGIELEHAARLADELVAGGLLGLASPPAFPDAVIKDAVYAAIAGAHRALLHGAAARALSADGASDAAVGAHLLRSEAAEDPSVVALLRSLAGQALSSGDAEAAAHLLRRALAEPPGPAERAAVLLELGLIESRAGYPAARERLGDASRHGSPAQQAAATAELADLDLLAGRHSEAIASLEQALARHSNSLGDEDTCLLEAELAACALVAGAPLADRRRPALEGGQDDTPGRRALLALVAAEAALAGGPASGTRALFERSSASQTAPPGRQPLPVAASMVVLWALETAELPLLERRIEHELQWATAIGSEASESAALVIRARARLTRGALHEAELDARRGLALARAHRLELPANLALSVLLEALVDQGRLADAARELSCDPAGERAPDDFAACALVSARGRLRAAAGEAHLGMRDLLAAGAHLLRGACATPSLGWRSRAGLLAHRLDRPDQARRLIDDEYTLARRLGAARPIGVALRAMAAITPGPQIELLEESARQLRRSTATLDLARTLCDLGASLRRSNVRAPAREPLLEALQLAHECGATAVAERARRELIVLGARPRRYAVTGAEALTAREREAGQLAADGLTNRQIADVMSVSPTTVEYHLTNAFRKLGITRREGLATELAAFGGEESRQPRAGV